MITTSEVEKALQLLGGDDIVVIQLNPPLDRIQQFIVVTGRSPRHLEKMNDALIKAVSPSHTQLVHIDQPGH